MNRQLLGLAVALCILAGSARTEEDNPLKKAKVGDWVSYKGVNEAGGMKMPMEMKQTVIKKTDTEVTIEIAQKVMGQDMKNQYTVDLTKKYDPRTTGLPNQDVQIKELEKGEESLAVGGKTLKTNWVSYEMTAKMGEQTITIKGKAWSCPDVPLGGMVKTASDMGMAKMTMELSDFGSGK